MTYEEAVAEAQRIHERYAQRANRELVEQMVDSGVASILSYVVGKAINEAVFYFRGNKLCSQAQFLRALEVILRNEATSVAEQVEVFSKIDEQEERRGGD